MTGEPELPHLGVGDLFTLVVVFPHGDWVKFAITTQLVSSKRTTTSAAKQQHRRPPKALSRSEISSEPRKMDIKVCWVVLVSCSGFDEEAAARPDDGS